MTKNRILSLTTYAFSALLAFSFTAPVFSVNADELIIDKDGTVSLVITQNDGVLAASTDKKTEEKKTESKPSQSVTLVSGKTPSKVEVHTTKNNQIEAKITVPSPSAPSSGPGGGPTTNAPTKSTEITKTVDSVVAKGSDATGKDTTVYSISSNPDNKLTITQQGAALSPVEAVVTVPILTIDTGSHAILVPTKQGNQTVNIPINVLPLPALTGAVQNRLISPSASTTQAPPKVTLIQDQLGQTMWDIQGKKTVNIFNFQVTAPVEVKTNVTSGQTSVKEPLYMRAATLLGF